MAVEISKPKDVTAIYLEHLKHYPVKACQPEVEGDKFVFRLSLLDIFECMVTKVVDKQAGRKVFYHRLIMEYADRKKQALIVRCDSDVFRAENATSYDSDVDHMSLVKRSAQFPANFEEPDYDIEITSEVTGRAPIPELIVGVKQAGVLIDDELTVKPGTPLNMEIELDAESADIYGVMVSKMEVTDTKAQSETLVFNGCTVDPFLFENFYTEDGDLLRAKFKAFKFPASNFVLFKGVVNVCLDRCNSVECANGQLGYGKRRRRRRTVEEEGAQKRLYEVSMSTIIRFQDEDAPAVQPETQPDQIPSARQRQQELLVEKAVLSSFFKPQPVQEEEHLVLEELAQEFGGYKRQTYVEFELDEEDRNSGVSSSQGFFAGLFALTTIALRLVN